MSNSNSVKRTRIVFMSQEDQCVGYFYHPVSIQGKLPCVVMVAGFCGTQDTPTLISNASDFAEVGIAALTFDYRNFGESAGEPRQVVNLKGQQEDFKAAVVWARSQPNIDADRIALWGSSLGGAHTIFVAAEDSRIAAVVAQVPWSGPSKEALGPRKHIFMLAVKDRLRSLFGLKPLYVPVVGTPDEGAVLIDPRAKEVTRGIADDSLWRNEVAPRILFSLVRLKPLSVAKKVQAPLLVSIAENDTEAPIYLTHQLAASAPHGEAKTYPITHYEIYHPEIRQQIFADQLEFLKKHLLS